MTRHPSCWSPPPRLPDLPAGEAVREWPVEVWGAPTRFPPPCAPGFIRAQSLGLLPPAAPANPPRPVPGLSSWDRMRWGLGLCFGLFALAIVLSNNVEIGVLAVPLTAAPFLGGVWLVLSTGGRDGVELGAGYTSGQAHVGLWRIAARSRAARTGPVGAPAGLVPLAVLPRPAAALGRAGLEAVAAALVVARGDVLPPSRAALLIVRSWQRALSTTHLGCRRPTWTAATGHLVW